MSIIVGEQSMRHAYGEALVEVGQENDRIVVLDADLANSTMTNIFRDKFANRFWNVGISEANLLGIAAGLALSNKIPFVSSYAIFAVGKAYDQIRNTIAYSSLNVKICATHGGLSAGLEGSSHQMLEDISIIRSIPNMHCIVPADAFETKAVIRTISKIDGPFYVRLPRMESPVIFDKNYKFQLGKSVCIHEGNDLCIIACGVMVASALSIAKKYLKKGISIRVINMSSIKPLDTYAIIKASLECGKIMTVEDHTVHGGLGSAVAEVVVKNNPVPMRFLGVQDRFGKSGHPYELFEKYGIDEKSIEAEILEFLKEK